MKKLRDQVLLGIFWLLGRLPYSWACSFGSWLGGLKTDLYAKRREIVESGLQSAFPNTSAEERSELAIASMSAAVRALFATLWIAGNGERRRQKAMPGREDAELRQLAVERGVIAMVLHSGSLDIAGKRTFDHSQIPCLILHSPVKQANLGAKIDSLRESKWMRCMPNNLTGLRRAVTEMKKSNALCWVPVDQTPRASSGAVSAPLFGKEVQTMTLASKLCQKFPDAVPVMMWSQLDSEGSYTLHWRRANPDVRSADLKASAHAINGEVETIVREIGRDFSWFYRRR